jgi:hypothetical protein
MKQKSFEGVAVYPREIPPNKHAVVGVWSRRDITERQLRQIKAHNALIDIGAIGVSTGVKGTAVIYIGPIKNVRTARKIALFLLKLVVVATGARSIVRDLADVTAVRRALVV